MGQKNIEKPSKADWRNFFMCLHCLYLSMSFDANLAEVEFDAHLEWNLALSSMSLNDWCSHNMQGFMKSTLANQFHFFSLWQGRCFPRPRGYPWPGATDPTWIILDLRGIFECWALPLWPSGAVGSRRPCSDTEWHKRARRSTEILEYLELVAAGICWLHRESQR